MGHAVSASFKGWTKDAATELRLSHCCVLKYDVIEYRIIFRHDILKLKSKPIISHQKDIR